MKFRFAITAVIRPYLEIEANDIDSAKELLVNGQFSRDEFIETGFPLDEDDIEINEIYDENDLRIEEEEDEEEDD